MKSITSIICLLLLTGCLLADGKQRGRAAWAWANACCNCQSEAVVKQPLATEAPKPTTIDPPQATGEIVGTCSSGSCSVSSTNTVQRFTLGRRRR